MLLSLPPDHTPDQLTLVDQLGDTQKGEQSGRKQRPWSPTKPTKPTKGVWIHCKHPCWWSVNAALNNPSHLWALLKPVPKNRRTPQLRHDFAIWIPKKNISSTKPDVLGGCSENQGQGSPLNSQIGKPQEPQTSLLVEDNHCPSPILVPQISSWKQWLHGRILLAEFSKMLVGQNSGTQPKRYPNNSWFSKMVSQKWEKYKVLTHLQIIPSGYD